MCRFARMGLLFLALSVGWGAPAAAGEEGRDEADLKQVRAFIAGVRRAANEGDHAAVAESFDIEEIVDSLRREGILALVQESQQAGLLPRLRRGLPVWLAQVGIVPPFESFEIRGVAPGPVPETFAVYVRLEDDDGVLSKMRWHLRRRGRVWRIYDIEDLDSGMGMISLIGLMDTAFPQEGDGDRVGLSAVSDELQSVQILLQDGEFQQARESLALLGRRKLPDMLAALVQMQLAATSLGEGDFEATIEHARQAAALKEDIPVLDYLRAVAFNMLEEYAQALAHARRYIAAVDADADVNLELGRALYGLKRLPEAVNALRSSLAGNPSDYEAIAYLALSLPAEKRGEIAAYLAKREEPLEDFEDIADICIAEEAPDVLRLFTSFLVKDDPERFDIPYFEGQACLLEEQPAKAVARFEEMLKRLSKVDMDPQDREPFHEAYLDAMIALGKHLAAFERCPDKALAFRHLAEDLSLEEKPGVLMDLVARAGTFEALLLDRRFYAADAQFLRKQYPPAIAILRPLLLQVRKLEKKEESDAALELLWEVEDRLVRSLVRTKAFDEALAIGQHVAERDEDFDYLLIVHANRGDVQAALAQLEKAASDPGDAERLFDDEDLETILEGAAYAEARAKYLPKR